MQQLDGRGLLRMVPCACMYHESIVTRQYSQFAKRVMILIHGQGDVPSDECAIAGSSPYQHRITFHQKKKRVTPVNFKASCRNAHAAGGVGYSLQYHQHMRAARLFNLLLQIKQGCNLSASH